MLAGMRAVPRVAFFPDSFHEVNGVAHTARNFVAYAKRHGFPFLCVHAAAPGVRGEPTVAHDGTVTLLGLPRGPLSVGLEKDLSFDPLFSRHYAAIGRALDDFRPDVLHMTGPSEMGMAAAYFAWKRKVPLAASWHTNVHEYAARRSAGVADVAPEIQRWVESGTLETTSRFYRLAKVLYAPNEELCSLLERKTGMRCHVMRRGVDTELFSPARRTRFASEDTLVLGYVGRLSVEKNIAMLPVLQRACDAAGLRTRFCIVGHGGDEAMLRDAMPGAEFAGVLRGEALATAYANMDLFVFPSETDTFGNVVLEALASGVPAAVTDGGGPKFIVTDEVTGIVRATRELPLAITNLLGDAARLRTMRTAARTYAEGCTWDAIFDGVYDGYAALFPAAEHPDQGPQPPVHSRPFEPRQ